VSTFALWRGEITRRIAELGLLATTASGCNAHEPAFRNAYWDNQRDGMYVDAVNGEPLFSSRDQFDSGTGWPAFGQPIEPERVATTSDWSFATLRTEIRSRGSDVYLGHLFDDGPAPTGLRYHVDSGALRFIVIDELEAHGYAEYGAFFPNAVPAKAAAD